MGITIGDALAAVGALFGVCGSLWALVIGVSLLFPARAEAARVAIERPWASFFRGLLAVATLGLLARVLSSSPAPLLKLLGTAIYIVLLAISAVGGAGLSLAASRRIREMDPDASEFSALVRGAGVLVLSGLLPVLGWFGIAPVALLVSLGAGLKAVFARRSPPVVVEPGTAWQ